MHSLKTQLTTPPVLAHFDLASPTLCLRFNAVMSQLQAANPNPPIAPTLAPGLDPAKHDLILLLHTPLQETVSLKKLQEASADNPSSTLSTSVRRCLGVKVPDELLTCYWLRVDLLDDTCSVHGLCTVYLLWGMRAT